MVTSEPPLPSVISALKMKDSALKRCFESAVYAILLMCISTFFFLLSSACSLYGFFLPFSLVCFLLWICQSAVVKWSLRDVIIDLLIFPSLACLLGLQICFYRTPCCILFTTNKLTWYIHVILDRSVLCAKVHGYYSTKTSESAALFRSLVWKQICLRRHNRWF